MKQYANERIAALCAYVPGEQPRDMQYIKLNTNESPFPPSPRVAERISGEEAKLNLYPDPACTELVAAAAASIGVKPENLIFTNGSDELLNFAFLAFCDAGRGIAFPDITYGLYAVLCEMYGIPYLKIPVGRDFSINPQDFCGVGRNVVIANPNAPTGLCLPVSDIEMIVRCNPGRVVIVDEAYVAFGGESCVGLVRKYDNLLVARTFSKSHSLAGARLGMGIGSPELIGYLNKVKYSFNPYSINRLTMLAGLAAFEDENYYTENCKKIITTRERVKAELRALGFSVTDSKANFLFARSDKIGGWELYEKLRRRGVLVRHFDAPGISDYNRITIGSESQMEAFLAALLEIIN
jgi:histidinol-phosphate aminotransferase